MPPRTQKAQSAKKIVYQKICLICLKTNILVKGIDEPLGYIYEDLCDFDCPKKRKMLFCEECINVLKKLYLFKKQCNAAIKLLTEWDKSDPELRKPITDLSNQLINYDFTESDDDDIDYQSDELTDDQCEIKTKTPKTPLKTTKKKESVNKPGVLDEDEVKIEMDDSDSTMDALEFHNNVTDSQDDVIDSKTGILDSHNNVTDSQDDVIDSKTGILDSHNVTDSLNDIAESSHDKADSDDSTDNKDIEIHELADIEDLKDDSDTETDDNFEDDCDLNDESVTVIVKNKENNKIINELLKGYKLKKDLPENTKKELNWMRRKPMQNQNQYEKVFDIVRFKNLEEVLADFAQRKFSDSYPKAKYRCDVCFNVYRAQKCLDVHMTWHDPSAGDRICEICSMRFVGTRQLCNHRSKCHSGKFSCKLCPLVTYHKNVMESHYRRHKGIEVKCKFCGTGFRHISTKLEHERREHGASHVCGACARTFSNVHGLRLHRALVHKTRSLVEAEGEARCDECNVTFTTADVYNIHLKNTPIHKDKASKMIVCGVCGKQVSSGRELIAHKREAHPRKNSQEKLSVKKISCEVCDATGTRVQWLYNHMRRDHPHVEYIPKCISRRKYLCDECGKGFISPATLADHKHLHTGERPFACKQCDKRYRTKQNLQLHEERHRPPARACPHCDKKFFTQSNLSNHIRSHIGDRRFKCKLCGKGFIHASLLNEHVRGVHLHERRVRKARPDKKGDAKS